MMWPAIATSTKLVAKKGYAWVKGSFDSANIHTTAEIKAMEKPTITGTLVISRKIISMRLFSL